MRYWTMWLYFKVEIEPFKPRDGVKIATTEAEAAEEDTANDGLLQNFFKHNK